MAKYLIQASYTTDGVKGLLKEGGSSRRRQVEQMVAKLGGKVDCFYYTFGDTDVIVIADLPDSVSAIAMSMAVNGSGAVTLKTTPLIDTEELDEATKKAVAYRAPGA